MTNPIYKILKVINLGLLWKLEFFISNKSLWLTERSIIKVFILPAYILLLLGPKWAFILDRNSNRSTNPVALQLCSHLSV